MCEFQVGDVVRIKFRDEMDGEPSFGWDDEMNYWSDTIQTITEVKDEQVWFANMNGAMRSWAWGTDMITLVEPANTSNLSGEWAQIVDAYRR